jgi:methionyl-tRNA formyltransferase
MSLAPSIIFYGTPEFAVPSLDILLKNKYPILAVVTAPDKPSGRGQKINFSPVKEYAVANNLNVLQPVNLKDENFIGELEKLKAELQVVVAFRMLPEKIWNMPSMGTFNLHASLLPQYRGAAPINWAIMNGEKETGITTFFLNKEIDSGKVIFREQTMIGKHETAGELHDRLMEAGAALVLKTVKAISNNDVHLKDQGEMNMGRELKVAPKLNKENTKLDIRKRPDQLVNFILGLSPYPGAHTQLNNKSGISFSLKIFSATPHNEVHPHPAGKVITDNKTYMNIYLPGGYVSVDELQLSGKNKVKIKDFLNGLKIEGDWYIE